MAIFAHAIGIDYSGAETPTASLKGLRVYLAEGEGLPVEVQPPPSPRKYWPSVRWCWRSVDISRHRSRGRPEFSP